MKTIKLSELDKALLNITTKLDVLDYLADDDNIESINEILTECHEEKMDILGSVNRIQKVFSIPGIANILSRINNFFVEIEYEGNAYTIHFTNKVLSHCFDGTLRTLITVNKGDKYSAIKPIGHFSIDNYGFLSTCTAEIAQNKSPEQRLILAVEEDILECSKVLETASEIIRAKLLVELVK